MLVVNKAMSIVTVRERVHAWEDRFRTAEGHSARKILCMTKTVVKVSPVVVPDSPKAKILLDRVRMEKMVWNEKVAARFFGMFVSGVTKR
mgnify:CR=1 FL=1